MKKTWIVLTLLLTVQVFAQKTEIFKENFPGGIHIVDGDTPVANIDQLDLILNTNSSDKLIVNTLAGNVLDVWNDVQRFELSYCISDSFGDNKERVINAFKTASNDWMKVANVKFIYLSGQDHNCTADNDLVLFDVRPVNVVYYLARAFFPATKRSARNVLVDESAYNYGDVAMIGFIRHELGHVLGFRHEHIHQESNGTCAEDDNFKPFTEYDTNSVMHYPHCGGTNSITDLAISDIDAEGAGIVYP